MGLERPSGSREARVSSQKVCTPQLYLTAGRASLIGHFLLWRGISRLLQRLHGQCRPGLTAPRRAGTDIPVIWEDAGKSARSAQLVSPGHGIQRQAPPPTAKPRL